MFYLFYRIKPSPMAKMEKFSARLVAPRMLDLMKVTGVLCHVIKTFLVNMYRRRTWCNKQERSSWSCSLVMPISSVASSSWFDHHHMPRIWDVSMENLNHYKHQDTPLFFFFGCEWKFHKCLFLIQLTYSHTLRIWDVYFYWWSCASFF